MARPLRIEYPDAWYHVTSRGNERRRIFGNDDDRKRFLRILKESAELFKVEVHCYVLMSNHFHFLLKTLLANLSRFMQRFNTTYTRYYNIRYRRSGHLYQGRYKAIVVEADEYLLEVSRYLHLNPVKTKANKGKTMEEKAKILKGYKWSSLPEYMSIRERKNYVHYDSVLNYMGGDTREGRRAYRDFVLAGIRAGGANPLDDVRAGVILGSDRFIEWIGDKFLQGRELRRKDYPRIKEIERDISVEDIARLVGGVYGVEAEDLLRRRSPLREARQVLIELSYGINLGKKSMEQLGKELGGIGGDAVAHAHERMQKKIKGNRKLAARVEHIRRELFSQ